MFTTGDGGVDFAEIIQQLRQKTDDPATLELLSIAEQSYVDRTKTWQSWGDLHEYLRQELGDINEMISEVRGEVQESNKAFSAFDDRFVIAADLLNVRLSGMENEVKAQQSMENAWLERHDRAIEELQARIPDYESLQRIVAHLAGYLDLSDDAMLSIDSKQCITWINGSAEYMFGYRSTELLGRPLGILIPKRFRKAHEHHVMAFGESNTGSRRMAERQLVYGIRKDGTEIPLKAAISQSIGGAGFAVVLRELRFTEVRDSKGEKP